MIAVAGGIVFGFGIMFAHWGLNALTNIYSTPPLLKTKREGVLSLLLAAYYYGLSLYVWRALV
jgi:hypothetical protein